MTIPELMKFIQDSRTYTLTQFEDTPRKIKPLSKRMLYEMARNMKWSMDPHHNWGANPRDEREASPQRGYFFWKTNLLP